MKKQHCAKSIQLYIQQCSIVVQLDVQWSTYPVQTTIKVDVWKVSFYKFFAYQQIDCRYFCRFIESACCCWNCVDDIQKKGRKSWTFSVFCVTSSKQKFLGNDLSLKYVNIYLKEVVNMDRNTLLYKNEELIRRLQLYLLYFTWTTSTSQSIVGHNVFVSTTSACIRWTRYQRARFPRTDIQKFIFEKFIPFTSVLKNCIRKCYNNFTKKSIIIILCSLM